MLGVNFVVFSALAIEEIGFEPAWKAYISGIVVRKSQDGIVRRR
jgi:hypothetical protein